MNKFYCHNFINLLYFILVRMIDSFQMIQTHVEEDVKKKKDTCRRKFDSYRQKETKKTYKIKYKEIFRGKNRAQP